ncbi:MAG TPA: alpha/beta hydrolase [Rubrivivax sp.]|jgi:pimeloyl-ACP methyl ester carboxylesterase|nr:alpha/beta hydrolase [Rubrivivax sp.]
MPTPYAARRPGRSQFIRLRGLNHHLNIWGDASLATAHRPPLLLMHGWMDVGASFQFTVDALARDRYVIAPDWRGFGLTDSTAGDCYWFPDYLGDLDALLDHLSPETPVDLCGHSMGGNVVMSYAGVRPTRVRRLINLEGFGMPQTQPQDAPKRLAQWLGELKAPQLMRSYASLDEVAARLVKTNPLLPADKAAWLAPHWSRQALDGRWHLLGDAAHKRVNPVLSRAEDTMATWSLISAPLLWVEGAGTEFGKWWGDRYTRAQFEQRLSVVPSVQRLQLKPAGHMLHHDQPEALARALEAFIDGA